MARTKLKRIMALLLDPNYNPISKYELAKKAGCTPSWVIMTIKNFEKQGIVKGLNVKNSRKLFNIFDKMRPKKQISRSYSIYQFDSINKLIELLQKFGREYAFTTYTAENIIQKYLFSHRVDVYVKKEELEDWHKELTKIGTYGGGNIRIMVSTQDEMFNKKQIGEKGPWIVNMPQLISDLYREGGPAKEAGDMLLENLVKKIEAKK